MVGDSQWTPELSRRWDEGIVRYPDPAVEVLDPRFSAYRVGNTAVERLFTGTRWAEGPVWFGDLRSLIFSDIPNNRHWHPGHAHWHSGPPPADVVGGAAPATQPAFAGGG